jgi:hypothetical protein
MEHGLSYQYIIFSRPDVRYLPPGLPDLAPYKLDSKEKEFSRRLGIAFEDRFVVGIPDLVEVWARRDEAAWQYMSAESKGTPFRPLHSEALVRYVLETHNISPVVVPICFERVRANGVAVPKDRQLCGWEGWARSPWKYATEERRVIGPPPRGIRSRKTNG